MKFDKTKGGWKYNRKGVQPVEDGVIVDVRERGGRHCTVLSCNQRWDKLGSDLDIIWWRKARKERKPIGHAPDLSEGMVRNAFEWIKSEPRLADDKQPAPIEIMQPGELKTDIGKYDAPRRRRMPPMWMAVVALVLVAVILAMVVA